MFSILHSTLEGVVEFTILLIVSKIREIKKEFIFFWIFLLLSKLLTVLQIVCFLKNIFMLNLLPCNLGWRIGIGVSSLSWAVDCKVKQWKILKEYSTIA